MQGLRDKTFLTPKEVQTALQIGETYLYNNLLKNAPFPVLRRGKLVRIPARPFFEWVDSLE